MEDVTAERLVLREVTTAPIFLRMGDRRRGPPGTGVGVMRRITIRDVEATDIRPTSRRSSPACRAIRSRTSRWRTSA
jgi:hypothetical protein